MQLPEVLQYLINNHYVIGSKQGFKLTKKFHEDIKKESPVNTDLIILRNQYYFSWENRYKQFIIRAAVPVRLKDNKGMLYSSNNYSEAGMRAYRKAIESGTEQDLLEKATMLYYNSGISYKVAIGRFITEGIWKTHYDTLLSAAKQGEQKLLDHIKNEVSDGTVDKYELG